MILSTLELEEMWREKLEAEFPTAVRHDALDDLTGEELKEVEILFTYGYDLEPERIQKMEKLRWIHIGQSGMDQVPFALLEKKQICLTNSRGINSITIAEYVICMILNIVRNTLAFQQAQRQGIWDKDTHLDELFEKTIGILGMGMVGKEISKRCKAFGMEVLGLDILPVGDENTDEMYLMEELESMLPICDFVVICMPLTSDNYHVFSREKFDSMKPTAYLLNVGRGPVINTIDLVEALREEKLAGAVLDVFEEEPLPPDSFLWKEKNLWITPHIAGDRQASYMPRMMGILCRNLNCYPQFSQMQNIVDIRRGF